MQARANLKVKTPVPNFASVQRQGVRLKRLLCAASWDPQVKERYWTLYGKGALTCNTAALSPSNLCAKCRRQEPWRASALSADDLALILLH